ncbi:MAG: hypothetical protein KME07_03875 [Pegethrix bostrychoides GSE-TBD4-15B]|jgi:hypothetical protein|uniref:Uncharacterized protein n=1 Tax=Pegethrix bostrychoides GSE-TBD4-15B TaxID=2839662 RepID=A0A951U3N9_9CYAN|nr:hypothetical protein [Pegethrix bostrychoides GSE-TBD4-15B]
MVRYNQAQTIDNLNDQLFTEISSEQAAMVEGGLQVVLTSIRSIQAGGGSDQVFASFNGRSADVLNGPDLTFSRPKFMTAGAFANIFTKGTSGPGVSMVVRLRDKSAPQGKNSLGGFTVREPGSGKRVFQLNGSRYEVGFLAFN